MFYREGFKAVVSPSYKEWNYVTKNESDHFENLIQFIIRLGIDIMYKEPEHTVAIWTFKFHEKSGFL